MSVLEPPTPPKNQHHDRESGLAAQLTAAAAALRENALAIANAHRLPVILVADSIHTEARRVLLINHKE